MKNNKMEIRNKRKKRIYIKIRKKSKMKKQKIKQKNETKKSKIKIKNKGYFEQIKRYI